MEQSVVHPETYLTNLEETLNRKYPFGIVPRKDISAATEGLLNSKYMANLDMRGTGIKNPVRVSRKIYYYIPEIINHLRKNTSTPTPTKEHN